MRVLIAVVGVLLGLAPRAQADWEYTKWGMTPEQVAGASKGTVKVVPVTDRYKNADDRWEIGAQGTFNAGSLNLDISFTFGIESGGLKCVFYNAIGQQAALVKGMMIQRFGPPAKDNNFLGAQTLEWTTPDHIELAMGQKPVAAVVTHCAP